MTGLPLLLGALLPALGAAEAPAPAPRPLPGLTTAQAQILIQTQPSSVGRFAGGRVPLVNQMTVRLLSDPEFLPRMALLGSDKRRAGRSLFAILVWGAASAAGAVWLWRGGGTRRKLTAGFVILTVFPIGCAGLVAGIYHREFALLFRVVRESLAGAFRGG